MSIDSVYLPAEPVPLGLGEEAGGYRSWSQMREQCVSQWYAQKRTTAVIKFSVLVPVYKPEPRWITECIQSVCAQHYPNWELILVDDASADLEIIAILNAAQLKDKRIITSFNKTSSGISTTTNRAAKLAVGDYFIFLDHDDLLDQYALIAFAQALKKKPETDILYADEDRFDDTYQRVHPGFKPNFSLEKLLATNYIHHPVIIRSTLFHQLRGFRSEFDGSQDYDLLLRACEITQRVVHVPDVLYHMRLHQGSMSMSAEAKPLAHEHGRQAVEQFLERNRINASVVESSVFPGHHTVIRNINTLPSVTVLIIGEEPMDLSVLQEEWGEQTQILYCANQSLNLAERVNDLAQSANSDLLVLTSASIKPENGWQQQLLSHAIRSDIGLVTGKIEYPDGLLFSCGWVIGIRACAGHWHTECNASDAGYGGWMNLTHEVSAVPWQLMVIQRDLFLSQGMLSTDFKNDGADIDFALRLHARLGLQHLVVPTAKFTYPRSEQETKVNVWNEQDFAKLWELWGEYLSAGDPYYSPHLSLLNEGISFLSMKEMELRNRGLFSFYDKTTRELLRKSFPN